MSGKVTGLPSAPSWTAATLWGDSALEARDARDRAEVLRRLRQAGLFV